MPMEVCGWSFMTQVIFPGNFNKSTPSNGATGLLTNPTTTWEASSDATSYEYCVSIYDVGYLLRRMDR